MKFSHIILFSLLLIGVSYSQNHLLISEIQVAPGSSEFIEIFNPNSAPVTLDNYYLSDYNTYYEVVNNQFTSESSDFLVKFPDGSRIDSAGVVVVAVDGSSFTGPVDFEIRNTSAVTDMTPLYVGSTASLSNAELVILFYWDGQGDLVSDVDYAMWGDLASNFIDKTGVSIDGQDPDPTPSAYLNDTPVSSQMPFAVAPISGKSMGRISVSENGEIFLNGNGINGHDETSEPVGQNFSLFDTPNPGTTELQIPTGNGSGIARVTPDSVMIDTTVTLQFSLQGTVPDTVTDISLEIPVSWNWSGNSSNVQMGGSGLSGAILNINGNVVGIASAEITLQHSGVITIDNLISPSQGEQSVFEIQTAISGGTPIPIAESPVVTVYEPMSITPIADIQANPSGFTQVTIDAIVVLGAGKTATGWTDAYVQDNSGAGINIYQGGSVDSRLVRGNRVLITGTVVEFISSGYKIGVTEITDYTLTVLSTGNALPDPLLLTTQEATNTDLEGTFVEVSGEVTDFIQDLGGGSNIRLDDGSGECLVRVWNSTGVNLSGVAVGEQLVVRGPLDIYQDANQLLLAYQEDLEIVQGQPGDGSGTASVSPDSVGQNQSGIELNFSISGESPYVLETVSLTVPADWQWTGSQTDVTLGGGGFAGSQLTISGRTITVTQASISSAISGELIISGLISPNQNMLSTFSVKTAVSGGILSPIDTSPTVTVGQGVTITPIADIQANPSGFTQVTIDAIVVLGAGKTTTSWTDAYVQDNSGAGINIYQGGSVDNRLVRGNRVLITGTVEEYQGVTEITDYKLNVLSTGNTLPNPLPLATQEATDTGLEGTFVEVSGEVTDFAQDIGGAANIRLDDGSGECLIRVWNSTGVNLAGVTVGEQLTVRGPLDIYQGNTQLLLAYQEDLSKPGDGVEGDGSGFAVTEPDSVEIGASGLSVNVTLWSTQEDTLRTVHILMPVGWGWTALAEDVVLAGSGLASARQQVVSDFGEYRIELTDCFITGSDTGLVTITGLTSPLESVISYFWIKTAVQGGSPAFIDTSPVIMVGDNPMLQIRDVQVNSAQFTSPVTIRGLVTVGAGILRTDRTSAYIQDESEYGINISQFGPPDQRFQRGFYVEVTGTVSEYRETTQMTPSGVSIIDSSAQLPAAIAVSTGDANHPRWDGTYIRVPRNVGEEHAVVIDKYTTSTQPPFDYNIVVNDGSGALTLRVWGTTGINLDSVLVNEAVIASGVGSVFLIDNEPSYQILPAYQSDIIPDEGYEPSLQGVDLDIPPYPFVPDRGEKILIRYNAGAVNNQVTVRIFDLGGRMITTLVDKPAELIVETIEWDGRDKLLDFVPVGTYICHLEVMEFVSGKKETRMAPIVIGTILK